MADEERRFLADAEIREFINENLRIRLHAEPDQTNMVKVKVELLLRRADSFHINEVDVIDSDLIYIQTGE
jgi:hypothetical protein